jgi:hypothetical protein
VRFELPIENKEIDANLRERLQHNLLYKDDTIFEHITFFQDAHDEVAQASKVTKKKDVFNGRSLLAKPVEVSSEEDDDEPSDRSMSLKNLSLSIENIQQQNISNSMMFHSFLDQKLGGEENLKESDLLIISNDE